MSIENVYMSFDYFAMWDEFDYYKSQGLCPGCKGEVNIKDLKAEYNIEEYAESGLCQGCQDDMLYQEIHYNLCLLLAESVKREMARG